MSKHTPGPWRVVSDGMISPKVVDANNLGICHTTYAPTGAEANARLIAVAPELLELLREAAGYTRHPDYDWPVEFSRRVDAAIAKATGEQQ